MGRPHVGPGDAAAAVVLLGMYIMLSTFPASAEAGEPAAPSSGAATETPAKPPELTDAQKALVTALVEETSAADGDGRPPIQL